MVTGRPSIASKMPMKSSLLIGLERREGLLAGRPRRRRGSSSACRRSAGPRRTCARCGRGRSPRRRTRGPWRRRSGVSAFVRTLSVRTLSAHDISVAKWPEIVGSTVGTLPIMTSPVVPLIVRKSPALTTWPLIVIWPFFSSMAIASQPTTQGLPQPRATTAAWLALPPVAVRMPLARCMPATSSGLVSLRTSRIGSSGCSSWKLTAASAERITLPHAAPGLAAMPLATTELLALGSSCGSSRWFRLSGLTRLSGGVLVDQAFLDHLDGDPHRGRPGPLAGAGLEHVERAVLRP